MLRHTLGVLALREARRFLLFCFWCVRLELAQGETEKVIDPVRDHEKQCTQSLQDRGDVRVGGPRGSGG